MDSLDNSLTKYTEIKAHQGLVLQATWAHPKFGSLIATGGIDKKILIFKEGNQHRFEKLYEYTDHNGTINSLAFSNQEIGLNLLAGSSDGYISLHIYNETSGNWNTFKLNGHSFGVNVVAWIQRNDHHSFITGGNDNLIREWNFSKNSSLENSEVSQLAGHSSRIREVAILEGSDSFASVDFEDNVFVWKFLDGKWSKYEVYFNSELVNSGIYKIQWSNCGNYLSVSTTESMYLCKETDEGWAVCSYLNTDGVMENVADENNEN